MKPILIVLFFAISAQAQTNTTIKKEKIKTLFVLMHQDSLIIKTIDVMTNAMVKNMSAIFTDSTYTKAGFDGSKFMQRIMEKSKIKSSENALQLLNKDMVDVYDKYFSLEEIELFSVFYSSPSGQKLLSQMPSITKDIMDAMSAKYKPAAMESMIKDIEELAKEMKEENKVEKK
jgi:uncharacterized protein